MEGWGIAGGAYLGLLLICICCGPLFILKIIIVNLAEGLRVIIITACIRT